MGFNISWIAATAISAEELAGQLGLDIGEEVGYPSTTGITTVGEWTLIYSNGAFLLGEDELAELSKGREVTTHQSVDTVMYATTAEYSNGALTRRAEVDLDKEEDGDAVSTLGHSDSQQKKLQSLNRKSGPSAYDEIAEIARRRVGFRHDRPGPKFRELVDTSPKPESTVDQLTEWLVSEGFQDKSEGSEQLFTRGGTDEFFVSVHISQHQQHSDWPSASVGIGHHPTHAKLAQLAGYKASARHHSPVAGVTQSSSPTSLRLRAEQSSDRLGFIIDHYSSLIDRTVRHCSIDGLLELAIGKSAFAAELATGWSTRGESLLRQLELLKFDDKWLERMRLMAAEQGEADEASLVRSPRDSRALRNQMSSGESLSGVELATMHEAKGGSEDLCKQLQYGHWSLALNDPDLPEDIALHLIQHHVPIEDLHVMAEIMPLSKAVEEALLDHEHDHIPNDVAANPALSEQAQIMLVTEGISHTIGGNPSLSQAAQHLLVENAVKPYALVALAGNPSLDPELQPILAKSKNYDVRRELASNPTVTPDVLLKLSKDRKGEVKVAAVTHPSLPQERQVEVAGGSAATAGLDRNPNLCAEAQALLVDRGDVGLLTRNLALVEELMEVLASDEDPRVRNGVAGAPNLPPHLHEQLATDPVEWVRSRVAARPDLDDGLHARLRQDDSEQVRKAAQRLGPLKFVDGHFIQDTV